MAAEMMGSVGVKQAAMTSDDMKLSGGKITKMTAGTQYETRGLLRDPIKRTCYNYPAKSHGRDNHDKETLSMVSQV